MVAELDAARPGGRDDRTWRVGGFHYGTTVPPGVDAKRVEARLDNGGAERSGAAPRASAARRIKIN
jgi:hypothetical protein